MFECLKLLGIWCMRKDSNRSLYSMMLAGQSSTERQYWPNIWPKPNIWLSRHLPKPDDERVINIFKGQTFHTSHRPHNLLHLSKYLALLLQDIVQCLPFDVQLLSYVCFLHQWICLAKLDNVVFFLVGFSCKLTLSRHCPACSAINLCTQL